MLPSEDTEEQEDEYRGKKKRPTVKNLLLTTLTGFLVFLSATIGEKYLIKHEPRKAGILLNPFTCWWI